MTAAATFNPPRPEQDDAKPQKERTEKTSRYLPPPMREGNEPDTRDEARRRWCFEHWESQDAAYRLRDRDIEENIRMLVGQHWWTYHHLLGWQDISYWMTDEEKRWRQRPVFNRMLPWYVLTHSKMTENPFICTFLPGPDHHDAELAEMLDALVKVKWRDAGMMQHWSRIVSWLIAGGTSFLQSRVDLTRGELLPWVGRAKLQLRRGDGSLIVGPDGQPIEREIPNGVPFNEKGEPLAHLRGESEEDEGKLEVTGEPHRERQGELAIDVFSPFECRGQWGPLPWYQQRIHMTRTYMTPEQVWEQYKIEVAPDITDLPAGSAGFVERLLFGSGLYGSASQPMHPYMTGASSASESEGYCTIQGTWLAPSDDIEGMAETEESPGGRLIVCSKDKVLNDTARPIRCKHTSPIRCFEFIRVPGRAWGSTPLEMMKGPQKAYNQGWKQILESTALSSNPQQTFDLDSGLREDQVDNMPGRIYGVRMKAGVKPIEWLTPPVMGADIWRRQALLLQELSYLGSQTGQEMAQQVSRRASGELLREARFNDDRFLGPTMRIAAEELGRMIDDWRAIFRVIYTTPTILRYTGEDNAARTLLLLPELMNEADATVVPDTESMLPEGRGQRRAQIYQMWKDGAFGNPEDPKALRMLYDYGRFPNMTAARQPGGIHRAMARQENMTMLEGKAPNLYPWQDHLTHLDEHETFMSSPEWDRLPDQLKAVFVQHRQDTVAAMVGKQQQVSGLAAAASQPVVPRGMPGGRPRMVSHGRPVTPAGPAGAPPGPAEPAAVPTEPVAAEA